MSLKDDWPSEPSPKYFQRALAQLDDVIRHSDVGRKIRTEEEIAKGNPLFQSPSPTPMEVTGPIFMFDPNERTMTVVDQTPSPTPRDVPHYVVNTNEVDERGHASFTEVTPESDASLFVTLDPNDPFEKAVISIVEMNRRKRADYAYDGDPFSNFTETAKMMGGSWTAADSAHFNVAQKMARLGALRSNGRMNDPANESVTDTRLDLAVYAIIAYPIHLQGETWDGIGQ